MQRPTLIELLLPISPKTLLYINNVVKAILSKDRKVIESVIRLIRGMDYLNLEHSIIALAFADFKMTQRF